MLGLGDKDKEKEQEGSQEGAAPEGAAPESSEEKVDEAAPAAAPKKGEPKAIDDKKMKQHVDDTNHGISEKELKMGMDVKMFGKEFVVKDITALDVVLRRKDIK